MNIEEYTTIKDKTYLEYCDYLQKKYGIGLADYMTKNWNKNSKCTRTSEGLIVHHKFEDHAIKLSEKEYAMQNPYEWQSAKNLVYCDYLEHLLLHVMICEYSLDSENTNQFVGIGGITAYIIPELNDFYSGWETKQQWRKTCHNLIANDKNVYLKILKRFKQNGSDYPLYTDSCLYKSYNEQFGLWSGQQNLSLYNEIKSL